MTSHTEACIIVGFGCAWCGWLVVVAQSWTEFVEYFLPVACRSLSQIVSVSTWTESYENYETPRRLESSPQ